MWSLGCRGTTVPDEPGRPDQKRALLTQRPFFSGSNPENGGIGGLPNSVSIPRSLEWYVQTGEKPDAEDVIDELAGVRRRVGVPPFRSKNRIDVTP